MNRVAIIILNYKGIRDTLECIASLLKQSEKDYSIVIIENGSQDGSSEKLKKFDNRRNVTVIINNNNLGFAGGVNVGIRYAIKHGAEFVALFNNDAIAHKDWLKELLQAQDKHRSGITTGLLLHRDGKTIDSTGDWYSIWGLPFPRNRGTLAKHAPASSFVFGATGGASLYSVEMLKKIGLFDEVFFAYYEDVDISFRAQLAGYRIYYCSTAIAYHAQGSTSKKMPGFAVYQTFKNLPLLFIKNIPKAFVWSIGIRFITAYSLMLINTIKNGTVWHALRGWISSITYTLDALKKRRSIQQTIAVNPTYIQSILWQDLPPNQTGLRKFRSLIKGRH